MLHSWGCSCCRVGLARGRRRNSCRTVCNSSKLLDNRSLEEGPLQKDNLTEPRRTNGVSSQALQKGSLTELPETNAVTAVTSEGLEKPATSGNQIAMATAAVPIVIVVP